MQPGENLTSVSAGDTVRWVIGDTLSGTGDNQRTHVLVKPFAPGLTTNLVITTDRRSYHLQLDSTEKTAMAAISWTYASDQLTTLRRQNAKAEGALPVASNVALENIRFRYAIIGDNPAWKPVRVFDDGHKVYVEFPRRIDQGEAPPLFVVGTDGGSELVNYRNDPFGQIGTNSVSVQVTSVVRASDTSFQIKWIEQVFERGSLARTERWTAILTTIIQPPRSAEQLRKNPLGLFVSAIDWSRELDTANPQEKHNKEPAK